MKKYKIIRSRSKYHMKNIQLQIIPNLNDLKLSFRICFNDLKSLASCSMIVSATGFEPRPSLIKEELRK